MAGSQIEMILGVLPVLTWLMASLLFVLAMYGALAAYIALNRDPHPLAQRSWQWLSETVGPPAQRSWQWLSERFTEQYDRLETYALNFLQAAMVCFLLWNLVGFALHFVVFFGRLLNARANVALDPEGVLYVVEHLPFCAPLTDAYNETSNEIMLAKAMAMAMDWTPPDKWPWYTCPWCLVVIAWPESAWDALCDVDFTVWILAVMVAIVAFFAMFIWSVYALVYWRAPAAAAPERNLGDSGRMGRAKSPSRTRLARAVSPGGDISSDLPDYCGNCKRFGKPCINAENSKSSKVHMGSVEWPCPPVGPA